MISIKFYLDVNRWAISDNIGQHNPRLGCWPCLIRCHCLRPSSASPGNSLLKYANDTYLIVPPVNAQSCAAEITHIEKWAVENNLSLHRAKSAEIVFVSPASKRADIPSPAVLGIARVETVKIRTHSCTCQ